jgi:hypothetical protein
MQKLMYVAYDFVGIKHESVAIRQFSGFSCRASHRIGKLAAPLPLDRLERRSPDRRPLWMRDQPFTARLAATAVENNESVRTWKCSGTDSIAWLGKLAATWIAF